MIEALKNEDLVKKVGGRFRLAAVVQKRMREIMMGARPLVEPGKMTAIEIVVKEIAEGKLQGSKPDAKGHDAKS